MKKLWIVSILCVLLGIWIASIQAFAHSMGNADIYVSVDGKAFTTNPGETDTQWYEEGYTIDMGVKSSLRALTPGEHYYLTDRDGNIPVGKWMVSHEKARCIHCAYPQGNYYHGEWFQKQICLKPYYSGWVSYCADCHEMVTGYFFYMSKETAKTIKAVDVSLDYYYKCPHCNNLEQAVTLKKHVCKAISANRYFVRYNANFGTGYMAKSSHIVNNATEYEGVEIIPQKHLNLNTYTRKGYVFAGWNTQKDGSGVSYEDGVEIYNLCLDENASIVLYAQWRKCNSILEIDAAGGSYQGRQGMQRIQGEYGSEYVLNPLELVPPKGYQVKFDTLGGEPIADMVGMQSFVEWSCSQPFYGTLQSDTYLFTGPDGAVDRVTAMYNREAIILPMAYKEGYSFGGWYADKEGNIPIGTAGDSVIPRENMLLYAAWVDLQLLSENNYIANQGKGAVNLTWQQKDNVGKAYEVFQKKEEEDWIKIEAVEEQEISLQVDRSLGFSGNEGVYTVPYEGFYELTLTGAQGGNYASYEGGLGGQTKATVYLEKGEKLYYVIGGQNGYPNGGVGKSYGNGGGYSKLWSQRLGIIMIAGGGGGASSWAAGENGGSTEQAGTSEEGQTGDSGGGGGYCGGIGGQLIVHQHQENCRHLHVGSSDINGGCYTVPIACGGTDFQYKKTHSVFYYGNLDWDGNIIYCVQCASYECPGHTVQYGIYVCKSCGYESEQAIEKCPVICKYALSCEQEENYICGFTEGEIVVKQSAYGGANYINEEACITYNEGIGVQKGNGTLQITFQQAGLLDVQELKGVFATDDKKPDKIAESSIRLTAVSETSIRVAFDRPKDNGTVYYHQVKSYDKETMKPMCQSNVTKNTLTSQIAGYRYCMDEETDTVVDDTDIFYAENGVDPFLVVDIDESIQYLHIAPQDKAGNVGETIHIGISTHTADTLYWPIITEKLLLESGENIYPAAEEDTYYVRADGNTPMLFIWEGLLCGSARKNYQINEAQFQVKEIVGSSIEGSLSIIVPNREGSLSGSFTYIAEQLRKRQSGMMGLEDASYTVAQRYQTCKSLNVKQKYTLPQMHDGKRLQVIPRAAVVGKEKKIYSEETRDLQNSIFLIADGKAPQISGTEQLLALEKLEEEQDEVAITLEAVDSGSGLATFSVEIHNMDNGGVKIYEDNGLTGKISFVVSPEDELFQGKFVVLVQAKDNVGNHGTWQNELLSLGLEANVERVLTPNVPIFKRGESGVLNITTWGYVEYMDIIFPSSFVCADASLPQQIVYDIPEAVQKERISFRVPLDVPDGELTIEVRAYKAGTQLSAEPKLITIQVKGSVLDELRTRLR